MFREASKATWGGDRKSDGIKTSNVSLDQSEHGTTRAYTLDRLHRENPDLYQRVVAGERRSPRDGVPGRADEPRACVPLDVAASCPAPFRCADEDVEAVTGQAALDVQDRFRDGGDELTRGRIIGVVQVVATQPATEHDAVPVASAVLHVGQRGPGCRVGARCWPSVHLHGPFAVGAGPPAPAHGCGEGAVVGTVGGHAAAGGAVQAGTSTSCRCGELGAAVLAGGGAGGHGVSQGAGG